MFDKLIRFSIHQRGLVMLIVISIAVLGGFSYKKLPIDAVPDITNVQVQINTSAPGYAPLETEQRVTYLLSSLPTLQHTYHRDDLVLTALLQNNRHNDQILLTNHVMFEYPRVKLLMVRLLHQKLNPR